MLMPEKLVKAFNDQITLEFQSSLAYLQMSAFFEQRSLRGMATWMRIQSEEERAHALRFFDYVLERGNQIALGPATPPRADFSSPVEVFEAALAQEQIVSASIADLYRVARFPVPCRARSIESCSCPKTSPKPSTTRSRWSSNHRSPTSR